MSIIDEILEAFDVALSYPDDKNVNRFQELIIDLRVRYNDQNK